MGRPPAALVGAALVLVAGSELVHWRASRVGPWGSPASGRPDVVLVLGYPSRRSGRLHPMQRWRTDIAVRSRRSTTARLVFSGAARGRRPSEAEVMARYAHRDLGVPAERIGLETRARTTWQNLAHTVDELERAGTITIASTPLHAVRARRYLARLRPDLAARLVPADDYRLGERWGWKLLGIVYAVARAAVPPEPEGVLLGRKPMA